MRRRLPAAILLALTGLAAAVCGGARDPQVVAIAYVRAINTGDPDGALELLDIDEIIRRVEEQIVVVQHANVESFLHDSVETLLWGLFQETPAGEYSYNATPPEISGDEATVVVIKTNVEGQQTETVVTLRGSRFGWRVSGESLEPLVTYVIQRLEERY